MDEHSNDEFYGLGIYDKMLIFLNKMVNNRKVEVHNSTKIHELQNI
jgi:hypothetical protein